MNKMIIATIHMCSGKST